MKTIAAIDLFAGPGGLNEGFSQFKSDTLNYDVRLSIEKDPVACRTLRLRAFCRQFGERNLPSAFYEYIRGNTEKLRELEALPEWHIAKEHVRQWTLGSKEGNDGYVSPTELHGAINGALSNAGDQWILLGGPPCQAYSLIGRARMTGVGAKVREADDPRKTAKSRRDLEASFATDHRHTLYREYLRVVAVHQPAAFVMENVKGILSARTRIKGDERIPQPKYAQVFDQIREDLRDPWRALADDLDAAALKDLNNRFKRGNHTYKLRSFVLKDGDEWAGLEGSEFVIRAEKFGVPQTRHRVILLGIRDDLTRTHTPLIPASSASTVRHMIANMPRLRSGISRDRRSVDKYGDDSPTAWRTALREEIAETLDASNDPHLTTAIKQALRDTEDLSDRGAAFAKCSHSLSSASTSLRRLMEDHQLGGVIQHQTRSHMASDLARYIYLAASTNKTAVTDQVTPTLEKWPKALLPKHANIRHEGRKRVVDGFVDRFRVQAWDRPSSTVTSHIQKDGHYFIHPDPSQCRSLTVREAARLQTFPENYYFEGNKTQQYLQVGNAVPPYLALQLAESVATLFEGTD